MAPCGWSADRCDLKSGICSSRKILHVRPRSSRPRSILRCRRCQRRWFPLVTNKLHHKGMAGLYLQCAAYYEFKSIRSARNDTYPGKALLVSALVGHSWQWVTMQPARRPWRTRHCWNPSSRNLSLYPVRDLFASSMSPFPVSVNAELINYLGRINSLPSTVIPQSHHRSQHPWMSGQGSPPLRPPRQREWVCVSSPSSP